MTAARAVAPVQEYGRWTASRDPQTLRSSRGGRVSIRPPLCKPVARGQKPLCWKHREGEAGGEPTLGCGAAVLCSPLRSRPSLSPSRAGGFWENGEQQGAPDRPRRGPGEEGRCLQWNFIPGSGWACWEDLAAIDGVGWMSPVQQQLAPLCSLRLKTRGVYRFAPSLPHRLRVQVSVLGSAPSRAECDVLGSFCVLREVEKAPSDSVAKGCAGTTFSTSERGCMQADLHMPKRLWV